jgi:hypothetical protein
MNTFVTSSPIRIVTKTFSALHLQISWSHRPFWQHGCWNVFHSLLLRGLCRNICHHNHFIIKIHSIIRDYGVSLLCATSGIIKNGTFRTLDLFPSSGESMGGTYYVGSIGSNLNHWTTYVCMYVCMYVSMYLSTAVCWTLPAFSVYWSFTQSVGLLRRGISPPQGRYLHTGQYEQRINAHRHPCLKWDSNPRSQCLNGRRPFMP